MADFKELKRYEKKTDSAHWKWLLPFTSYLHKEEYHILHDYPGFALIDTVVSSLCMISLYASPSVNNSSRATMPDEVRYNLHLNEIMAQSISLKGLGTVWLGSLVTILLVIQIFKYCAIYFALSKCTNNRTSNNTSHAFLQALIGYTTLSLTVFLFFIIESCVLNVLYGSLGFKIIGAILLLTIPLDILIHTLVTFDYKFVRTNIVQARSYTQFNIRVTGTFLWASFRYFTRDLDNNLIYIIGDLLGLCFCIVLLSFETMNFTFFRFFWHNFVTILLHSLFFVAGCLQTFSCLDVVPFLGNSLYIFKLTITPLIWIMLLNFSKASVRSLMSTGLVTGRETAEQSVMFMEMLQFFHENRKLSWDHEMQLLTSVITHYRSCKDPLCMCFLLRDKYDSSLGASKTLFAKELHKHFHQTTKGKIWNSLSTFGDLHSVQYRKELHNEYITAKPVTGMRKILISSEEISGEDTEKCEYVHNFENEENFKLAMSSIFYSIYRRFLETSDAFKVASAFMRYLVTEYKNQLAALIFIYQHIYSRKYQAESSFFRDLFLQHLMVKSKRILKMTSEDNIRLVTNKLHLTKVLDYRLRVEKLARTNQELTAGKGELYKGLSDSEIDYLKTIKKGSKIYHGTKETKSEIEALLKINDKNMLLLKEAAHFETCVQEKSSISDRLRKKAQQIYQEHKFKFGESEKSSNNKFNFSPFSSSNVVIFLAYEDGDYRCFSHTQNACDLFEATPAELHKNTLTEFMPPVVGVMHNRLLFDFINGNSRAKKSGKFNTFVISKKAKIRSCIVQPKLDAGFLNNIYIAGMAILRDKNDSPIIYTTSKGSIVGMNSKANSILNKKKPFLETTIFSTFPKLHGTYFQDESAQRMYSGKTIGSKTMGNQTSPTFQENSMGNLDPQQMATLGLSPSASVTLNGFQPQLQLGGYNTNGLMADSGENEFLKETQNYQAFMLQFNTPGTPDASRGSQSSTKSVKRKRILERTELGVLNGNQQNLQTKESEVDVTLFKKKTTGEVNLRDFERDVDQDTKSDPSLKAVETRSKKSSKRGTELENSKHYSAAHSSEPEDCVLVVGIDDLITKQKSLLESKTMKISKVTISVENSRFQRQIKYKEVTIRAVQKLNASERTILKMISTAPNEIVEEVLCGDPQVVSYLNKIVIYTRILGVIEEVLSRQFSKEQLQDEDTIQHEGLLEEEYYERSLAPVNPGKITAPQVMFSPDLRKSEEPAAINKASYLGRMTTKVPISIIKPPSADDGAKGGLQKGVMEPSGQETRESSSPPGFLKVAKKADKRVIAESNKNRVQLIPVGFAEDIGSSIGKSPGAADETRASGLDPNYDRDEALKIVTSMRKKHKELNVKINEIREELIQLMSNPMLLDKIVQFVVDSKINRFHWTEHDRNTNIWGDVASLWLEKIGSEIGHFANAHMFKDGAMHSEILEPADKHPQSLEHVKSQASQTEVKDVVGAMVDYLLVNTAPSSDDEENEFGENKAGDTDAVAESKKSIETELIEPPESTSGKNAKRDRKAISDAMLTRSQIKTAHKRLNFRRWEKGMFIAVFFCFSMKVLFTSFLLRASYMYKDSIENDKQIAEIFEVFGYFFKETQRISISKSLLQISGVTIGAPVPISSIYHKERYSYFQSKLKGYYKNVTLNSEIPDAFYIEAPALLKVDKLESTGLLYRTALLVDVLSSKYNPANRSSSVWQTSTSEPAISRLDQIWIELCSITQQMSSRLMDYLRNRIERNKSITNEWTLLYVLNYLAETYALISFPIVIAAISVSMQQQTFSASEILLRIERNCFREAFERIMSKANPNGGNHKEAVMDVHKNGEENHLIKVSDLKKEAQEERPTIDKAAHAYMAESEDAPMNNRPRNKKRFVLHRAAHINKANGSDGRKAYSVYTNRVAPYSTLKTYIWTCLIVVVMDMLFLATLIIVQSSTNKFKLALDETVDVSIAKGSINMVTGISYNRFVNANSKWLPTNTSMSYDKLSEYETTFQRSKSLNSVYYSTKILSTRLCEAALQGFGNKGSLSDCYSGLQVPTDFTVIQGLNQFDFRLNNLKIEIESNPTAQSTRDFFTGSNYESMENLALYQGLALSKLQTETVTEINDDLHSMLGTYLILVATHLVLKVLLTCYLKIFWAPQRLHHWSYLQETFLTLNSDILSNIYVKTYFVNEMGG